MKTLTIAIVALLLTATSFAQGQINFATKVGTDVDAPVVIFGTPNGPHGPGPDWTAQLYFQSQNGSLTPLFPATIFRSGSPIESRYVVPVDPVIVPGIPPGNPATVIMRAWLTSFGSFDAAEASGGGFAESIPLTIPSLGGGLLPDSNLSGLQGFSVVPLDGPEPSIIALGILGGSLLLLRRRK